MDKKLKNGFTLLEVMIALLIFSIFILSFMSVQNSNINSSYKAQSELYLKSYAINKLNEIITTPPSFQEALTLRALTGVFKDNDDIEWEITYRRFEAPGYAVISGIKTDEQNLEEREKHALGTKIYENIKKNMKDLLWQVQVKVTQKTTNKFYIISTWIKNTQAKVELNI